MPIDKVGILCYKVFDRLSGVNNGSSKRSWRRRKGDNS